MKIREDIRPQDRGFKTVEEINIFLESDYFKSWYVLARDEFIRWCTGDGLLIKEVPALVDVVEKLQSETPVYEEVIEITQEELQEEIQEEVKEEVKEETVEKEVKKNNKK